MNELQIFNYGEIPVRTVLMDGEPWWVLADVCRVLDLSNPTTVAARLDDDEKQRLAFNPKSDLGLGHNGATIINESGLYKVILRSDKPEAKAFTRWVTHEVLPAIRKTGSYGVTITEKEPFTNEQRIKVMDILSRCTQFTLPHVLKYCDPEWPVCEPEKVKELSVSITVPPKSEFGEWLTAALREHGMKQAELAEKVGCAKSSISQYCSGKTKPRASVYQTIMMMLDDTRASSGGSRPQLRIMPPTRTRRTTKRSTLPLRGLHWLGRGYRMERSLHNERKPEAGYR